MANDEGEDLCCVECTVCELEFHHTCLSYLKMANDEGEIFTVLNVQHVSRGDWSFITLALVI